MKAEGSQRWKIALVVVAFAATAFVVARQLTRPSVVSDSIQLICVTTGERFTMSRQAVTQVPMLHPKTNEPTLLPISANVKGEFVVHDHYRGLVEEFGEKNKFVDPQTLVVKNSK